MNKLIPIAVVGLVSATMLSVPAAALQSGESAPAFRLADQFGKTWELSTLKNNVVVVVAANKISGRAMGPWIDNLKSKYGAKITLLGLMDLRGMPGFARGITRSRIRNETKDPLMIDFNGETAKAYQINDKSPVVVVIDRAGVLRAVEKNPHNKETFAGITAAIDKALESPPAK